MKHLFEYSGKNVNLIYSIFENEYYLDRLLVNHRTHIENNQLGYGERAFHTLWRELVKALPAGFKFLEIGVYKGQILSLVKLLSKAYQKESSVLGVTPLSMAGDKYSSYHNSNYGKIIADLFLELDLEFDPTVELIVGSSTDNSIKSKIIEAGPFDLIYIDGCHDYECVVSDIQLMKKSTKVGSMIVFDDSACFTDLQGNRFKGHLDVCNAVKDEVESDLNFEEVLCVGHNRVFKRIGQLD